MENLDSLRPPRRGSGTGSEDDVMLPRSVSDTRRLGDMLEDSFQPAPGQRVVEVHRTDDEMVRAVWWWKDDELMITLQWLVNVDGSWHALNFPPSFSEP